MNDLRGRITAALAEPRAPSSDFDLNKGIALPPDRRLRPAAVLAAIAPGPEPTVLLTKRSSALKHHPGQIAFPGGKQDPDDATLAEAAKREAKEEIGLRPENVEIIGQLAPHETVTGFVVTPFIGLVHSAFDPVPEAGEVDEVFRVPLAHVLNPANFIIEGRRWQGRMRHYYAVPYGPYYIWGATARMLRAWAEQMQ